MAVRDFGHRLREARERRGLTQLEAGRLLGISNANISAYELGKREPDFDTLSRFADLYGCTTDYLLGLVDQPNEFEPMYRLEERVRMAEDLVTSTTERLADVRRRRDKASTPEQRAFLDGIVEQLTHDLATFRGEMDAAKYDLEEARRRRGKTERDSDHSPTDELIYFLRGQDLTPEDVEAVKDLLEARRLRRQREQQEKGQP